MHIDLILLCDIIERNPEIRIKYIDRYCLFSCLHIRETTASAVLWLNQYTEFCNFQECHICYQTEQKSIFVYICIRSRTKDNY